MRFWIHYNEYRDRHLAESYSYNVSIKYVCNALSRRDTFSYSPVVPELDSHALPLPSLLVIDSIYAIQLTVKAIPASTWCLLMLFCTLWPVTWPAAGQFAFINILESLSAKKEVAKRMKRLGKAGSGACISLAGYLHEAAISDF